MLKENNGKEERQEKIGHICVALKKLCTGTLQRLEKHEEFLLPSAGNRFVRLSLENIAPNSAFGHRENDYLSLKIPI